MKPFYYHGHIITASCKEEAINKIIAGRPLEKRGEDYRDRTFDYENRAKKHIEREIKKAIPNCKNIQFEDSNSSSWVRLTARCSRSLSDFKVVLDRNNISYSGNEMECDIHPSAKFTDFKNDKQVKIFAQLAKQLNAPITVIVYGYVNKLSEELMDVSRRNDSYSFLQKIAKEIKIPGVTIHFTNAKGYHDYQLCVKSEDISKICPINKMNEEESEEERIKRETLSDNLYGFDTNGHFYYGPEDNNAYISFLWDTCGDTGVDINDIKGIIGAFKKSGCKKIGLWIEY